jgi:site-specific DNA-adenine methylase
MSYKFIEGFCGSSAISIYLCGQKSLLPYQGSKWKFRKQISALINENGFIGKPQEIHLYDIGPWDIVLKTLISSKKEVIQLLNDFNKKDPRELYTLLNKSKIPDDHISLTAEFLFLQRLSFSGKAVGTTHGFWDSPGFNKTSAYGLKATSKFGEIKPMIVSLIKRINENNFNSIPLTTIGKFLPYPKENVLNTVVYLDPPYQGSTKYPDGDVSRNNLIDLGLAWYKAGALVLISESEPIKELNWKEFKISEKSFNKVNFQNKNEEWITYNMLSKNN